MSTDVNRIAAITWLAEHAEGFGRTALMKYCYFLQVIGRVPLGYHFSLYSYGPFDSEVLSDLDSAEAMGGVETSVEYYPRGYGYKIQRGVRADRVKSLGGSFLEQYAAEFDRVTAEFRGWNASELEIASTLVYSDREAARKRENVNLHEISRRVRDLKPRCGIEQIQVYAERLHRLGFLQAVN
jgi:hypothetical protein